MSFIEDLFIELGDSHFDYPPYRFLPHASRRNNKRVPFRQLAETHGVSDATFYTTLSRLKQRGLLQKSGSAWYITQKGKILFAKLMRKKEFGKLAKREKNMIITFDIPENLRKKRAWLRGELSLLGFSAIQKSVWLGPAPLPKAFVGDLKDKNILTYLRFFEAKTHEIV